MLGEAKGDPEGRSWTLGVLTPARSRANHRTGPLRCLCLLRRSTSIRNTFQIPPSYTGGKLSVGCAGGNRLQRTRTANSVRFPRPKSWVGTPAARAVPAQPGSSVVQTRNSPRGPAAPQPRFLLSHHFLGRGLARGPGHSWAVTAAAGTCGVSSWATWRRCAARTLRFLVPFPTGPARPPPSSRTAAPARTG